MIQKLLKAIDLAAGQALKQCAQPYVGTNESVAYHAGVRVGTVAGIQHARQAIIDAVSKDESKDNDL